MSTVIRVTAYFASLLAAGTIGYYVHQPNTIVKKVAEREIIDYTNRNTLEDVWHRMPEEFRKEKVKEGIPNLSRRDLYEIGAEYAIKLLKDRKSQADNNYSKKETLSKEPLSRDNAQKVYDMLKTYTEGTR